MPSREPGCTRFGGRNPGQEPEFARRLAATSPGTAKSVSFVSSGYIAAVGSNSMVEKTVVEVLTPLLGAHTSRRAYALACESAGKPHRDATVEDVDAICDGLTPMLRTLLGKEPAGRVVRAIRRRIGGPA